MLLLSVIFTWFAVLAPSMAETEVERRVAALEYQFARQERKLDDVERELYSVARSQGHRGESGCPSGHEAHLDSCYLFSADKVSQMSAEHLCKLQSSDAYLVEIDNVDENIFIKAKSKYHGGKFWIGLADNEYEGRFMWINSSNDLESGEFNDWGKTEPNGGTRENCVLLDDNQSNRWADYPCGRSEHFICELKMGSKIRDELFVGI